MNSGNQAVEMLDEEQFYYGCTIIILNTVQGYTIIITLAVFSKKKVKVMRSPLHLHCCPCRGRLGYLHAKTFIWAMTSTFHGGF